MAQKLTPVYDYPKRGGKNIKSFRVHLAKKPVLDIVGFNEDTNIQVNYEKRKNYHWRRETNVKKEYPLHKLWSVRQQIFKQKFNQALYRTKSFPNSLYNKEITLSKG